MITVFVATLMVTKETRWIKAIRLALVVQIVADLTRMSHQSTAVFSLSIHAVWLAYFFVFKRIKSLESINRFDQMETWKCRG